MTSSLYVVVEDPWPSPIRCNGGPMAFPYMLWLGQTRASSAQGLSQEGPASRLLAFPVKIMFACCLSLPSATPHKGDSLILVCSEPSQG